MDINKETFEELCAGYVLNALSQEDERTFLKALESADENQLMLLEELKLVASELALISKTENASANIKEEILAQAKTNVNANIKYLPRYRFAAAASFILLFATIALFIYSQNLSSTLEDQLATVELQQNRITALETEVDQKETLLAILESRDVDLVIMAGLEVNPNGYGKVVWDKENGKALIQVANLPSSAERDYQLWFVTDNQPISAGIFGLNNTDNDSFFSLQEFSNPANAGAFAITLEPKGGSPQPTGDMYLLGSL